MTPHISRRRALVLLAGVGVAAGGGLTYVSRSDDLPSPPPSPGAESEDRPPAGELVVIGERYLDQFPDERSVEVLTRQLDLPDAGVGSFAAVRVRMRQELAAGDVVRIDGWVLSRTEARLCALLALGD